MNYFHHNINVSIPCVHQTWAYYICICIISPLNIQGFWFINLINNFRTLIMNYCYLTVVPLQEEQAVLDKIVRERKASLARPSQGLTPHIMVSEASGSDLSDAMFFGNPRRSSTQSMGPVVVPVCSTLYTLDRRARS